MEHLLLSAFGVAALCQVTAEAWGFLALSRATSYLRWCGLPGSGHQPPASANVMSWYLDAVSEGSVSAGERVRKAESSAQLGLYPEQERITTHAGQVGEIEMASPHSSNELGSPIGPGDLRSSLTLSAYPPCR